MVVSRRHAVRCTVRGIAIGLVGLAIAPLILRLFDAYPYNMGNVADRPIGWFHDELAFAATMIVVALSLWLLQQPLSRWVVPLAKPACPKCGYALTKLEHSRCPECGCDVPKCFGDE
jgi:hypothetical protein